MDEFLEVRAAFYPYIRLESKAKSISSSFKEIDYKNPIAFLS